MKRLSLTQPTILLMVGVPGAGKSFFAWQFAENYNLPYVSQDRIRSELFNQPTHTSDEQEIIGRVADYMVDELLRGGSHFIVDGHLGNIRSHRLSMTRRAREAGYRLLIIWVQVDAQTAKIRSLKRNPKKRDDQYNQPLTEAVFEALKKQLTPPASEEQVVVSGKHTFPAQHKMVLRKLAQASQPKKDDQPAAPKVVTPTPERPMGRPTPRPENRRIIIS